MAIVFHQIRIPNGVDFRLNLGNDTNRMNRVTDKNNGEPSGQPVCGTVYSSRLDLSKILTQNKKGTLATKKWPFMTHLILPVFYELDIEYF